MMSLSTRLPMTRSCICILVAKTATAQLKKCINIIVIVVVTIIIIIIYARNEEKRTIEQSK